MPPIRTPARNRYSAMYGEEEDHGFDPAWAQKPQPLPVASTPLEPVAQFESPPKPPPPNVVVTHLPRNSASHQGDLTFGVGIASNANCTKSVDSDGVAWGILLPLAVIYNVIKGVADVTGGAIYTGYRGARAIGGTVARIRGAVRNAFPPRHDPIQRRRPKTPIKKSLKDSMLALPPHMVGATPNVVRQARGDKLRGEAGDHTPSNEEARKWSLFHATPLPKKPKLVPQTPLQNAGPGTPWKTPKFEFNTSQRKLRIGKTKEFALNVHKGEFKDWLRLLKKNGLGTTALRQELNENLAFPTDLILSLHDKMVKGQSSDFSSLVKCFSHEGFTTHYKILVPTLKNPAPLKFHHSEAGAIDINSVRQQADGCCRFCRGYSWAGQVEVRKIDKGADVPCRSLHRSVVPYAAEEKAEFARHKYEMLFRRWCRESRYDWIFDTPEISDWEVPKDDPRLRHISMVKQQHQTICGAPKLYNGDLIAGYNHQREELTKQDIAAKVLIDAVRQENPLLAAIYETMDLERKRRQVRTDWLCVKQVKIVRREAAQKRKASRADSNSAQNWSRQPEDRSPNSEPEKPAKRVKFASQPEGPTANGRKAPVKGILKNTTNYTSKMQRKTPQSRKKPSLKKARTSPSTTRGSSYGLFLQGSGQDPSAAKTNSEPVYQSNAPLTQTNNQLNNLQPLSQQLVPCSPHTESPSSKLNNNNNKHSTFAAPSSSQALQANPKTDFAARPALSYQVPQLQPGPLFFFGAASSKAAEYSGYLPPAFDPTVIRQHYNAGIANAGGFWDRPEPFGWKPDPPGSSW